MTNRTNNLTSKIVLCMLLVIAQTGCAATKMPFSYQYPDAKQAQSPGLVLLFSGVVDQRSDRDIDKIYEADPIKEISRILREELLSMGLFSNIILASEGTPTSQVENATFVIEPKLDVLKWEVPDYDSKKFWAFTTSLLTGGLGGTIYGMSDTDVYGHSRMRIKLSSMKTGETVVDKDYLGVAKEVMIKFKCDTPETKSTMVGKSLKNLMEKFKSDLYLAHVQPVK